MTDPTCPIIFANEALETCGGIQRYLTCIAREFRALYGDVRIIEPRPGDRGTIRALYRAWTCYTSAVIKLRPTFTLASLWFPSGFIAAVLPRKLRGKLAILAHGSEISSKSWLRAKLMRWTYSRADAIFANSDFVSKLLSDNGIKNRVTIVACGTDQISPRVHSGDRPIILSVGRLIERKGFDVTIMALPRIVESFPNVVYEIVGEGPYRERLEDLARRLDVERFIVFRGYIGDRQLADAYGRASCFVLPTRRIRDDVEGFGIVYLEAAIAGLPTIGGIDSGANAAIEDGVTGHLVDGSNPEAVASAIIELLSNETASTRMGERGRSRALRDFSWARAAKQIRAAMIAG